MSVKLLHVLGSIRHQEKLLDVMKTWKVDTVYHAAAYKHVPMIEHNIAEGVK
ncbi:UDP-N-acetyl-alpha-D-glucosamine C6 dehydratase [compost metagenome]